MVDAVAKRDITLVQAASRRSWSNEGCHEKSETSLHSKAYRFDSDLQEGLA